MWVEGKATLGACAATHPRPTLTYTDPPEPTSTHPTHPDTLRPTLTHSRPTPTRPDPPQPTQPTPTLPDLPQRSSTHFSPPQPILPHPDPPRPILGPHTSTGGTQIHQWHTQTSICLALLVKRQSSVNWSFRVVRHVVSCVVSYRFVSCRLVLFRIRVVSFRVVPCRVISCCFVSFRVAIRLGIDDEH